MDAEQGQGTREIDVLAFGEALVDLISRRTVSSLADADDFRRFLGGQAANVALNVARLGGRAAVVGCVGEDGFGVFVRTQLESAGVSTRYLQVTADTPTSVVVNTRQTGTPDFIHLRGADAHIQFSDLHKQAIRSSHVVHASALALSRDPSRSSVMSALRLARESGCLVSLDPNYHPKIWPDVEDFRPILEQAYRWVDVTKPSLDDCVRLFGPDLPPAGYARKFLNWGVGTVALTMGRQGVLLATADGEMGYIQPRQMRVEDVTGAGDAFWAGMLTALVDDYSPLDAACIGQIVAETKIGIVGPLPDTLDRTDLYDQLEMVREKSVSSPPMNMLTG